jgi:parvulin-like peptidyl-prolyl isomerase
MKECCEMLPKGCENYRLVALCKALLVIIGLIVLLPRDCSALWPFSFPKKEPKEPYLARVGDKIITSSEFTETVKKLHMSGRVGKALAMQKGFAKQDFVRFLDELIDNKLMVLEAENIGLDKERDFVADMNKYTLNLSLGRLRKEEISDKVKVKDSEIEEYYYEQLRKEEEEKAREATDKQEGEGIVKDEDDKNEQPKKMTLRERSRIKRLIIAQKEKEREKEYFAQLRRKARVKVDEEVLMGISLDKPELFESAVAYINGEPLTGKELLMAMRGRDPKDLEAKRKVLDGLVLNKLLDQEAMSRRYEEDPTLNKRIKSHRERLLIDKFKIKAVLPLVKVEEGEILEYYNKNKDQFRESDRIRLRGIFVMDLEEGISVAEELKKGADFSFLAREKSIDPSRGKGGDLGWLPANRFSADILMAFEEAAEGDILGPFAYKNGYSVFEFLGIEKGLYIPLEKVRSVIDRTIGKQKFNSVLKNYLKRLRAAVPVDINEDELKKLAGE